MIPDKINSRLSTQQREFVNKFFSQCPELITSRIMLKTYPENHTLISADDTCPYVYLLLEGRLQAIEEHVIDEPYHFTEIKAIEIVGDFELFTSSTTRIITLTTLEKSLFLVMSATDYISWIQKDVNALYIRAQMLIRQLVSQAQFDRRNFFLDNHTRFLYFLSNEYHRISSGTSTVKIRYTRPEIANKLGCSVRTVNRIITELQTEGLIDLEHGKISINYNQYLSIQHVYDSSSEKNEYFLEI